MGNGERVGVSMGVDGKTNTRGGGAPQRGHGALLEPLAQLGDALRSVGAFASGVEAAELIVGQAAKLGRRKCQGRWHESKHSAAGSSAGRPTRVIAAWSCP